MSLIPQTTCRRCHRKYSKLRPHCPYCGYKNEKEAPRAVPESDSVVKGSEASRKAKEAVSWQLLIGAILIVLVVVAMIAVISVDMSGRIDETVTIGSDAEMPDVEVETTPVPNPTPSPTPSPTPAPTVTSVQITFYGVDEPGFMEGPGTEVPLEASWYPANIDAEVVWSSSDESVATVTEDGVVTVVGSSGQQCVIYATVGGVSDACDVWVR